MEQKIEEWADSVKRAGCTVNAIQTLHEIRKSDGTMLFSLIDADVTSPEGTRLPNIIFIRGHACVIVPQIENSSTGEKKFLMVHQRRIGSGQMSLEFPAGMLDEHSGDPTGIAIKELHEETGLQLNSDSIFLLHDKLLYSSVGGSDEGIYYYGCTVKIDNPTFLSFKNRLTGNRSENECITVELISREDAESQATTMQVPLGFYLFEKHLMRSEFNTSHRLKI
jgi:8-oxo-dGTP pyrophosphatase MutT (NUDIX family)